MKVRELIEQLQQLDPERNVWIFYDTPCAALEPHFGGIADEEHVGYFGDRGVAVGDYYDEVG